MGRLESIFCCQNCNKTLWLKYYKLPDGRTVCLKCFDFLIRSGEIEKIKEKEKRGILGSIFNCQNCSITLWLNYYKLPDGRTVCPKCFDFLIRTGEIEKIKIKIKKFENERDLLSVLNRKEIDG